MVVLRAIGRFFARIGRWIRDTAWVQPLLIVGGIFAIIFAIPYVIDGVQSWFEDSTATYVKFYEDYQLSLEDCDENNSEADGLLQYLVDASTGSQTEAQTRKYGEKFYLCFVQEGCSGCESNYYGFNYLADNVNKSSSFELNGGSDSFRLYSIFMDETDEDIDYDGNIFDHYIFDTYQQIFETAVEIATDTYNYNYLINQGGESSDYYSTATSMADEMESPTIFVIDLSAEGGYASSFGISEVLFAYDGKDSESTAYAKCLTLVDAWNHEGIFAEGYKA